MNIEQSLMQEFGLDHIRSTSLLPGGSVNCHLVVTSDQSYVYKPAGRADFVRVQDRMQRALNERGHLQARVIPTRTGQLITSDGHTLLEFIPGEVPERFSQGQLQSVIRYSHSYNRALSSVPFAPEELAQDSIWDKAKSLDFICSQAESAGYLAALDGADSHLLSQAICLLRDQTTLLQALPQQLVHSDLGPGNVVFAGERVRTIIDFTPDYQHELYSLAQLLYWTCLYEWDDASLERLKAALPIYYGGDGALTEQNKFLLFIQLIKACLFRVIGPLLQMIETKNLHPSRLTKRLAAVRTLLDLQPELI